MNIPADFDFSQASLQDYLDCPQRFYLRYIKRLAWPAIQSEPARESERHMLRGQAFHRQVQRYLLGMSLDELNPQAAAEYELKQWWRHFLAHAAPQLQGIRHVEISLRTRLEGCPLVAVMDLVLVEASGQLSIFDWKTSRKPLKTRTLARRCQTMIYPFLLAEAGGFLIAKGANAPRTIHPSSIRMIYWSTAAPQKFITFPYSPEKHAQNRADLSRLIHEILALPETGFSRTEEENRCSYCVYRSYCDRGARAGFFAAETGMDEEENAATGFDIDFDQISEIQF